MNKLLKIILCIIPFVNVPLQILYVIACGWFLLYYGIFPLIIGIALFPVAMIACPILEIIFWKSCVILAIGVVILLCWLFIFAAHKFIDE